MEITKVRKEKYCMHYQRNKEYNPKGGIIEKEGSIHVSNVMIIADGKPTRINNKILKDGSKVKISNKTGNQLK